MIRANRLSHTGGVTMTIAKPTKEQLLWQEQEPGVIIHYVANVYKPELSFS